MSIPEDIQVPTYPQYTNLALNEGLMDQLMATVQHHLDKQYKDGRIRGDKYAEVYVASLEGVMQNTTTYLLGTMLIGEQKAKAAAEIALTETQELKIGVETELLELEKIKLQYMIEEILPLEKSKLTQEIASMVAQVVLLGKQGDKIDKEIEFLTAKILTEQANTQTGIASADSLIGRQMSLLQAQKMGFAGDLQIKAAKLIADYDAVYQGVQETAETATLSNGAAGVVGAGTSLTVHDALGGISNAQTTAAAIALL